MWLRQNFKFEVYISCASADLATVLGFVSDEGDDAHVHDGGKVVEHGDEHVGDQLETTVRPNQRQHLVQVHRSA